MYFDEVLFTIISEEGLKDLEYAILPFILDVVIVYLNLYVLIPRYLQVKKYLTYSIFSIMSVVFNVALMTLYFALQENEMPYPEDIVASIISTMTLLATAVAIKIGKNLYVQQKETELLRLEQSKLELNYLKQQVNPHFLFNVLNTIHIQSQTNPQEVSETVLQLSDILRYQIYDAGKSKTVPLKKEIDFLNNYAALEQTRRKNLMLNWKSPSIVPTVRVTPFLFLPLIENAFKHSRSTTESVQTINVHWEIYEGRIILKVENSIGDFQEDNDGGFGVDNLRKRLELLYPKRHTLKLSIKKNTFESILELETDEGYNN